MIQYTLIAIHKNGNNFGPTCLSRFKTLGEAHDYLSTLDSDDAKGFIIVTSKGVVHFYNADYSVLKADSL